MRKNLRDARIASGLTITELARKCGIGLSTLGNFETGKTNLSPEKLKRVAEALKRQPDFILADENDPAPAHETNLKDFLSSIRITCPRYALRMLDDDTVRESLSQAIDKSMWDSATLCAAELYLRANPKPA